MGTTWADVSRPSTTWSDVSRPASLWRLPNKLWDNLYSLISDYLICWYSFDEISGNLIDRSVNSLDGIKSGEPAYKQIDQAGREGAIRFDPDNSSYFYHADDPLFDLNGAEILDNGDLENWTGDTPDDWSKAEGGTSTIEDETTEVHGDSHSAKFTIDASNSIARLYQAKALEANKPYVVVFFYKTEASKYVMARLTTVVDGTTYYLKSDGTWTTVASFYVDSLANTSWTPNVFHFDSMDAGDYTLDVRRHDAASSVFYIDDVSITRVYDAIFYVIANLGTDVSAIRAVCSKRQSSLIRWDLMLGTNKKLQFYARDGTNAILLQSDSDQNQGIWKLFEVRLKRNSVTGGDIFINGASDVVSKIDMTGLGNLGNTGQFLLGAFASTYIANGPISEFIMIKGDDLSSLMTPAFAQQVYGYSEI